MKILKEIDNFLYSKSKKEIIYIYLAIALVIGFIFYYFIYPIAKDYSNREKNRFNDYVKLQESLITRKNVYQARVTLLQKNIKKLQAKVDVLKKQKAFYLNLVMLLDFAKFDKEKWAKLVKETVDLAQNEGMQVVKVYNNIYDDENETKKINNDKIIVKRMDMQMYLKGDYKNFIFYIFDFENRKDLIRVNEFNITSPNDYYLKISVYGFKQ